MPIPQGKPTANKTRWALPENPQPAGFRCLNIRVPDDDYYAEQLLGMLFRLSQQNRYDRDEAHTAKTVAATWLSATYETINRWQESCETCPEVPLPEKIVELQKIVKIEEIEIMSGLKIEYIDGVPYIEDDCGCGTRKYYQLTESAINPSTGAIAQAGDSPPAYIDSVELPTQTAADCYSAAVASTITTALAEFTGAVFDFAVLGAGALFPVTTAAIISAVEINQAITAALNGNLTLNFSNVGYTANEVIAEFESAEFQQFLVDRLGDDQQISRWVLDLVALRLLNNNSLNTPTPLYPVFAAWVRMCDIAALNQKLQIAATGCANGNSLVDPGQCWEIDLTAIESLESVGIVINNSGGTIIGEFVQGSGVKPVNVGQWNIAMSYPAIAGLDIQQVGFECLDGTMSGQTRFRSVGNYNDITLSVTGAETNVSGQNDIWISSAVTTTDGAGWYFNQMVDGEFISVLRIKYATATIPQASLTPISCP